MKIELEETEIWALLDVISSLQREPNPASKVHASTLQAVYEQLQAANAAAIGHLRPDSKPARDGYYAAADRTGGHLPDRSKALSAPYSRF